jgi:hypothetical protein
MIPFQLMRLVRGISRSGSRQKAMPIGPRQRRPAVEGLERRQLLSQVSKISLPTTKAIALPASLGEFGFNIHAKEKGNATGGTVGITLSLGSGPGTDELGIGWSQNLPGSPGQSLNGENFSLGLTLKKVDRVYELVLPGATSDKGHGHKSNVADEQPSLTEQVLTAGEGKNKRAIGVKITIGRPLNIELAYDITGNTGNHIPKSAAEPVSIRVDYGSSAGGASVSLAGRLTVARDGHLVVVAKS